MMKSFGLLLVVAASAEAWYYRGTTNNWGAEKMFEMNGKFCACLEMEQGDKFKIDRWANWQESYPSSDYVIWEGRGIYDICIDPASPWRPESLTVQKHAHFFFRGTPNNWGATEMFVGEGGKFCTSQVFEANGRFKVSVSPTSYMVAYPDQDRVVPQAGEYRVCFDALYRELFVNRLEEGGSWWLRGSHNRWSADEMFQMGDNWCACVLFEEEHGEFKVSRYEDSWEEAYPQQNYRLQDGSGVYDICFDPVSKELVHVGIHEHWFIRGSNKKWGPGEEMTIDEETGRFCTVQLFEEGDEQLAYKVSVTADDWNMPSFPAANRVLSAPGLYRICFDSLFRTHFEELITTPVPTTQAPETEAPQTEAPEPDFTCPPSVPFFACFDCFATQAEADRAALEC